MAIQCRIRYVMCVKRGYGGAGVAVPYSAIKLGLCGVGCAWFSNSVLPDHGAAVLILPRHAAVLFMRCAPGLPCLPACLLVWYGRYAMHALRAAVMHLLRY